MKYDPRTKKQLADLNAMREVNYRRRDIEATKMPKVPMVQQGCLLKKNKGI